MSDIFYSQVDANLQTELNLRGRSGRYSRTTADLRFMLEKIANVELVAYETPDRDKIIEPATLGGQTVRSGEYLPSGPNGFVTDRNYTVTDTTIIAGGVSDASKINSSRRTPPFITSCDVTIGDHSAGILNSATINITIPNPERDLNFIESVYFRPGRACTITIMHPESAILSDNKYMTRKTLPSTETLINTGASSIKNAEELWKTYAKLNTLKFDGLITKFTFEYQTDMSVIATLEMRGTSNLYPDLKLIMDSNSNNNVTQTTNKQIIPNTQIFQPIGNIQNPFENFSIVPQQTPKPVVNSIYKTLIDEVNARFDQPNFGPSNQLLGYTTQYLTDTTIQQGDDVVAIKGSPYKGSEPKTYITLAWLMDFINRIILPRLTSVTPNPKIVCTKKNNLIISNYYEYLVSANPERIFISNNKYGSIEWFADVIQEQNITLPQFSNKEKQESYPTSIFINTEVIQSIINKLDAEKQFTLSKFLQEISTEIKIATGNAINMMLITQPDLQDTLLYYDANRIKLDGVTPYSVPMFANHKNGTIIRDFKFSSNVPASVSTLAYVTNRDPGELSESDIAPFMSYMYSANTVTRSGTNEYIGNLLTQTQLYELNQTYVDNYNKYLRDYNTALDAFGKNPSNTETQKTLELALQKYIQFPTSTIQKSSQLLAPIIPFDVEFTIDGINGFRYGDVLEFDALPTRYKVNSVFLIVGITHTVGTDGVWTSTVRCLMRAKIG